MGFWLAMTKVIQNVYQSIGTGVTITGTRNKNMSQRSSCLYCMIFRSKVSRSLHRVSNTPNNPLYQCFK